MAFFDVILYWVQGSIEAAVFFFAMIIEGTQSFGFILANFCLIMALNYFVVPFVARSLGSDRARKKGDDDD